MERRQGQTHPFAVIANIISQAMRSLRGTLHKLLLSIWCYWRSPSKLCRRLIHLTPYTVEALKRHRSRQHEAQQAAGPLWDDQGWVFCNSRGRPIEVASLLTRSFRPLLEKAGLPRIRFHDLRHAFASFLLALGVHPKVVQEAMGHSQVSQTFDTYAHLLPTLQGEAINRLDDLLSNHG